MLSTQFLLTSLVVVLVPGTGALYTISTGITRDWRAGIAAAFGCTMGIVPHLVASALGLSAIMNMGAQVFTVVKLAGAAYLLYLGWQMWKDTGTLTIERDRDPQGAFAITGRAIVLNLLNPKLTIFFLAFLPHFIDPDAGSALPQMAVLSAVFMAMTFVVFCLYALVAAGTRALVGVTPKALRWLQRSFAVAFAGLAIELAISDR